jgi:ABC-2 type transport system permease protein
MKGLTGAWLHLALTEARLLWRDPASILVPVGLPVGVLMMGGLGAHDPNASGFGDDGTFEVAVVPLALVMIVGMIGLLNLPTFLVERRRDRWLRRLAVTPARPVMLLAAQALVSLTLSLAGVAIALTLARIAFGVSAPHDLGAAIGVFGLAVAALFAVGMVIAAVARTTSAAIAAGLVLFFGMFALVGGFGGGEALPQWLATAGTHTPMGAAAGALTDAWGPANVSITAINILIFTTVTSTIAAVATFRWE